MPDPRLLLLTDSNVFAGTERHILDLATALHALSASVTVACPAGAPLAVRAAAVGIPVMAIEKRGSIDLAAVRILKHMLRAGQIDLIHAHNGRTQLAAAMAVSRAGRGAVVATQHFLAPTRTTRRGVRGWISRIIHSYTAKRTAHLIAISNAVRDAMLARQDAGPSHVTVVLNGFHGDVSTGPSSSPSDQATIRSSLDLPADVPLIFCAARLTAEKGLTDLIDAMAIVRQQTPAAVCVIAGEGKLRAELEQQINMRNLSASVRLLGFRDDIPQLMRAADLFVLPSPAEPFGLVLLEAMAAGKSVIATRAGGPIEIVDDGVTGLLVPPHAPGDLASAIIRLLNDLALRAQMGAAGAQRIKDRFSASQMATEMLAVYRKALRGERTTDHGQHAKPLVEVP